MAKTDSILLPSNLKDIPEYEVWKKMRQRCCNPRHTSYRNYGGRGIEVCSRWDAFRAFLDDMGHRPSPKHSLDRIDNGGNYEPENCRWATPQQQQRNRRNNHLLTHNGQTMSIAEWSDQTGIHRRTLLNRISRNGWTVERALTTPETGGKQFTVDGITLSLTEWAKRHNMHVRTLRSRLQNGLPIEEALRTPVRHYIHSSSALRGKHDTNKLQAPSRWLQLNPPRHCRLMQ